MGCSVSDLEEKIVLLGGSFRGSVLDAECHGSEAGFGDDEVGVAEVAGVADTIG